MAAATGITVRLALFGDMRRYLPPRQDGPLTCTLPAPATVAALLDTLGITPVEDMAISVNGDLRDMATTLADGDDLTLFGPMEGG